jgi:hypothetical protein
MSVAKVFKIVANFSYRYFIIGNQSPGNLERISNGIAASVRTGEFHTPKDVAEAFRAINPDANFRSDFELAVMPKTRSRLARYTLAALSNHMSKQSNKVGSELITNPDAKQVTLEHILPQSPSPEWKSGFSSGVNPDDYIYRIGNLTLLITKANRDAANVSYAEKKKIALSDSSLAINWTFRAINNWGEQEIEQRQAQLAKVALDVWKL